MWRKIAYSTGTYSYMHQSQNYIHSSSQLMRMKRELEKTYIFSIINSLMESSGCHYKDAQSCAIDIIQSLVPIAVEKNDIHALTVKGKLNKLIRKKANEIKLFQEKNFKLSQHQFTDLVTATQRGDLALFEHAFLSHFNLCVHFLKKKYNASHDDAYDITMDTMLDFRKRIVDGKVTYGNLRFLFTQMASQLYQKKINKNHTVSLDGIELEDKIIEIDKEGLATLKKAWSKLSDSCQDLLKKYFYGKMKLTEIAEEENKSSAAIRKQKQRCVAVLKNYFTQNIYPQKNPL